MTDEVKRFKELYSKYIGYKEKRAESIGAKHSLVKQLEEHHFSTVKDAENFIVESNIERSKLQTKLNKHLDEIEKCSLSNNLD